MAILIIDDSATQRLALAGLLEAEGYADLFLASSAAEALGLLTMLPPEIVDLILTDLHMPDIDGIEACRQIRARPAWGDVPIIMVTSSGETENLKQAFAAGAMDYITKPPDEIELLARVRSALRLKYATEQRKARERELVVLNQRLEDVLADLAVQHQMLQEEQERSERLLLNILPRPIAEQLKRTPAVIAEQFDAATVLFADIVGFTALASQYSPTELVALLNEIFSRFDALAAHQGLEKIKTIGDAYMVVGGLPMPRQDHARAVVALALEMRAAIHELAGGLLRVRIGIHSGPVVAGVIGATKFSYDLWGDTVNVASRMESHGAPDAIQISAATYALIQHTFLCEPRGLIAVKGKGELEAWFVHGPLNAQESLVELVTRPAESTKDS